MPVRARGPVLKSEERLVNKDSAPPMSPFFWLVVVMILALVVLSVIRMWRARRG